jgi:hypothetical protein
MKQKITEFIKSKLAFIKKYWKWTIFAVVVLLIVIPKLMPKGFDPKTEIIEVAKIMDLKKTVRI